MNAKQLVKALDKFDQQMADAYGEGDDFPAIESVVPIEAQKILLKKYGDIPKAVLDGINDKVESLNDAMAELDHALEVLKYIGKGLADSEELAQQVADLEAEPEAEHAGVGSGEDTEGNRTKGE